MRLIRTATTLAVAAACAAQSAAGAQGSGAVQLRLLSRRAIATDATYPALGLTGANKPNGRMYRLRESIPNSLPSYVPRVRGGPYLTIADSTAEGWLAFYRQPPGSTEPRNARYSAVLYGKSGNPAWSLDLNALLSRRDRLEITDVRLVDGKLYFNESCQSYAREAGRRCSSLVRVDPRSRRVEWRTPSLTSNGIFIPAGAWIVTGYGFTAEPDFVYLVDRATGRVVARAGVDSAPDYLEMKDGRLYVATYRSLYQLQIVPGASSTRR